MLSLITFHIRITHFSWLVMTLQWGSGFMRWGSCSQGGVIEAIGPLKPKKVALFRNKSYYECHYFYQILLKSPHQKLLPGPTPVCSCCAPETSRCIYFQWRNAKLVRIKITIRGVMARVGQSVFNVSTNNFAPLLRPWACVCNSCLHMRLNFPFQWMTSDT